MKYFDTILLYALSITACAQRPQAPPGDNLQFLRLARYIADNVRIADPEALGQVLHTTFTGHLNDRENTLCRIPSAPLQISYTQFSPSAEFWFTRRPSGTVIKYMTGPDVFNPNTKVEERTLDAPQLNYLLIRTKTCASIGPAPAHADVPVPGVISPTVLGFVNIPGYACISADEVRTVFPNLSTPRWTDVEPPLQYIGSRNTIDLYIGAGDFQEGRNGPIHHQPACLTSLSFEPHISHGK